MTPNHWRAISEFPNKRTDPRMVKNFRVVANAGAKGFPDSM